MCMRPGGAEKDAKEKSPEIEEKVKNQIPLDRDRVNKQACQL